MKLLTAWITASLCGAVASLFALALLLTVGVVAQAMESETLWAIVSLPILAAPIFMFVLVGGLPFALPAAILGTAICGSIEHIFALRFMWILWAMAGALMAIYLAYEVVYDTSGDLTLFQPDKSPWAGDNLGLMIKFAISGCYGAFVARRLRAVMVEWAIFKPETE